MQTTINNAQTEQTINNAIDYSLSGGTRGSFTNSNEQGFGVMEASNTFTITATIAVSDPARPVFIIQQSDVLRPQLGFYAARFPRDVAGNDVYDLFPITQVPAYYPKMATTTNVVANAYFDLALWPSGTRSGFVPFTSSAAGYYPLNLDNGAGYGVANANFQEVFDRGYCVGNRMQVRSTIIDAGINAFQGSIYGGIIQQKMTPEVATKSGLAGLTNAKHGTFYTGSIADPAVCVTIPNTQEMAYFTNDSIRELSQTRVLKQTFAAPTATYTIRNFAADTAVFNGQGIPAFNAIENGLFFNQNPCLAHVQIGFTRNATVDAAPYGTVSICMYADYANVDQNDQLVITSMLVDQFNVPIDIAVNQPQSINMSFDVPSPVKPLGTLIRPMPFYFVGIRYTTAVYEGSSLSAVSFDSYYSQFSITTTITIDDLSLTGDEVSGVIALNDYTGPFEAVQDLRFAAIPNVRNSALLGPYIQPPEFLENIKIVKDFLSVILGRSGGLIGSQAMYDDVMDRLKDKDKAYVMAPRGGYNMSTLHRALSSRMVAPSRVISDDNYFSASLLKKMKNFGNKVMRSPAGGVIREIGNTAYKVGGNMLYDLAEQETGVDFRDLAEASGLRGNRYHSSDVEQTEFGTNRFNPANTRPAMYCSSFRLPKGLRKDAHPSVRNALVRLKKGNADVDDHALVSNILAAAGQVLRDGYNNSDVNEDFSLPDVEEDEPVAIPQRQYLNPVYGCEVSKVVVPNFSGLSAVLSRIVERKTTPYGKAYFISIPESEYSTPLIVTLSVEPKLPSTSQTFIPYFFKVLGETGRQRAVRVMPEETSNLLIYVSQILAFEDSAFEAAVSYLLRCGVTFQNTEHVLVDESFIGTPLSGNSFMLAFVMACLQTPLGPVFTGVVNDEGAVGPIGDPDIKIKAVCDNEFKPTLFIARTQVNEESHGVIMRTLTRMNYFRLGKRESSVIQLDYVSQIYSTLFSTAMAPALANSTQTFQEKDKRSAPSKQSLLDMQARKDRVEKNMALNAAGTLEQATRAAIAKALKDAKGVFMQQVSNNRAYFMHQGERIDNLSLGAFNKAFPRFGLTSGDVGGLGKQITVNLDYLGEIMPLEVVVLDASMLTPIQKVTKPKVVALKKVVLSAADFEEY